MSQTARGLAFAATGRLADAEAAQKAVAALKDDPALKTSFVSSVNTASAIVAIAHEVLSGDIEAKRRRADRAAGHFAKAAALEDALIYMEPPDWPVPVRRLQGAALLGLGRTKEAEAAFRGDLAKFPDNGWSLSGLQASLEKQGKMTEASTVNARFAEQWKQSDVQIAAGRPLAMPVGGAAARK
jgi:tetratricopeptide (TPR) repeat protein